MKEPKIYIGQNNTAIKEDEYDVLIFLPIGFTGNTEQIISDAKFKYLELSERESNRKPIVERNYLVVPSRPKRKRIGQ